MSILVHIWLIVYDCTPPLTHIWFFQIVIYEQLFCAYMSVIYDHHIRTTFCAYMSVIYDSSKSSYTNNFFVRIWVSYMITSLHIYEDHIATYYARIRISYMISMQGFNICNQPVTAYIWFKHMISYMSVIYRSQIHILTHIWLSYMMLVYVTHIQVHHYGVI